MFSLEVLKGRTETMPTRPADVEESTGGGGGRDSDGHSRRVCKWRWSVGRGLRGEENRRGEGASGHWACKRKGMGGMEDGDKI